MYLFNNLAQSLIDLKNEVFKLKDGEFTEKEISSIKDTYSSWLMILTEDRLKELDNN